MTHDLKTPHSPKTFNKALFQERQWWSMVSCCKLLGVRAFLLEVRSQSGNDLLVTLYQTNVILCSNKKRQAPKAQLSPSKVQVLAKRKQISVGGYLRDRSPDSAQLSSLRGPGLQPSWPSGLRLPRAGWGRQASQTVTQANCRCSYFTETGRCRGSLLLQGWPWSGLWSPTGNRFRPVPWASAHSLSQGQETSWRAPGKRPGLPLPADPTC